MTNEELITNYPRLFHMAERNTWSMIKTYGLLSTSALLDLFEVDVKKRESLESRHRPTSIIIESAKYGSAVIRDQKPMSDGGLQRALYGSSLSPRQWYELLNRKVFFWLREKRLATLLSAREYRNRVHTVLTIDTARLMAVHGGKVLLSPINSGCTKPMPHPRGLGTFLPVAQFPFTARSKTRNLDSAVVELTVEYSVSNIEDFVTRVVHMKSDETIEVLFDSKSKK